MSALITGSLQTVSRREAFDAGDNASSDESLSSTFSFDDHREDENRPAHRGPRVREFDMTTATQNRELKRSPPAPGPTKRKQLDALNPKDVTLTPLNGLTPKGITLTLRGVYPRQHNNSKLVSYSNAHH